MLHQCKWVLVFPISSLNISLFFNCSPMLVRTCLSFSSLSISLFFNVPLVLVLTPLPFSSSSIFLVSLSCSSVPEGISFNGICLSTVTELDTNQHDGRWLIRSVNKLDFINQLLLLEFVYSWNKWIQNFTNELLKKICQLVILPKYCFFGIMQNQLWFKWEITITELIHNEKLGRNNARIKWQNNLVSIFIQDFDKGWNRTVTNIFNNW